LLSQPKTSVIKPAVSALARFTPDPLVPLGERVDCGGVFISRRGPGEGVAPVHTDIPSLFLLM